MCQLGPHEPPRTGPPATSYRQTAKVARVVSPGKRQKPAIVAYFAHVGESTPDSHRGDDDLKQSSTRLVADDEVLAAPLLWPGENIRRLHCPLPFHSGQARSGGRHDFISTYLAYLELDHVPLVRAIRALFNPDNHAVLYHCAAGKDRTGVLSAIVLEILGVPRETIAADYALSGTRIHRVVARLAPIEICSPDPSAAAAGVLAAEPGTILTFLDELDARHGGAERWLLAHGVQSHEIERFRQTMLTTDQNYE